IRDQLAYLADERTLRLKIKDVARHWGLYYLGCLKIGWNEIENEVDVTVIRPQKLILDPEGIIIAGKFTGRYIGELRTADAETLITRFPDKKKQIEAIVKGKLATQLNYTEWWTPEYIFFTLGEV